MCVLFCMKKGCRIEGATVTLQYTTCELRGRHYHKLGVRETEKEFHHSSRIREEADWQDDN